MRGLMDGVLHLMALVVSPDGDAGDAGAGPVAAGIALALGRELGERR